jgi:hypothetical protein
MFKITRRWIQECAPERGRWSAAQLAVFGLPAAPPEGWQDGLVGQLCSPEARRAFEALGKAEAEARNC